MNNHNNVFISSKVAWAALSVGSHIRNVSSHLHKMASMNGSSQNTRFPQDKMVKILVGKDWIQKLNQKLRG